MRVAIIGCGQLARMLALSAIGQGIQFSFLADLGDKSDARPVEGLGPLVKWREGMTGKEMYDALGQPDVITFEKEQITTPHFIDLEKYTYIAPSFKALSVCQNRNKEKLFLKELGIPSAEFIYSSDPQTLYEFLEKGPLPMVVKSTTEGYDGKNQWHIQESSEIRTIPETAIRSGVIAEEWIDFSHEVSLVSVRNKKGDIKHYPLTENRHKKGILIESIAPTRSVDSKEKAAAEAYMVKILESLEYVGTLGMECFVTSRGILINELAPRVHNSGHWTQNGAATCQFENHIRAITGQAIGSTKSEGVTGMINLIGSYSLMLDQLPENAYLHWYNKEPREGRKLGHINVKAQGHDQLEKMMSDLTALMES